MTYENRTRSLALTGILCIGAAFSISAVAADSAGATADNAGVYVKNSVITTKVKSKLAAKHMSTLTKIKVDTDKDGVVWLSGMAPTKDASDVAELVAKGTDGVTSVHNNIVVSE